MTGPKTMCDVYLMDEAGDQGDAEAARQQREAEQAEAARRERRKTLALNKLRCRRRNGASRFRADASGESLPRGGGLRQADCLTRDRRLLEENHADDVAAELLGVSGTEAVRKSITELGASGDARAQVITLALVLGALEARLPRKTRGAAAAWAGSAPSGAAATCGSWRPTPTRSARSRRSSRERRPLTASMRTT